MNTRKSNKIVKGLGIKDVKYPANIKEYDLWRQMICRCTEEYLSKRPSYVGTSCSENFKSYTFFYEWCQEQVGFGNIDEKGNCWQIDKDLLVKGNKLYSEDTCVFVPLAVNCLLTKRQSKRGVLQIGVSIHKKTGKFVARCSNGAGVSKHIGLFCTPQEAFTLVMEACVAIGEKQVRAFVEYAKTNKPHRYLTMRTGFKKGILANSSTEVFEASDFMNRPPAPNTESTTTTATAAAGDDLPF